VDWLDAARYADTHGYHIDSGRDMWPWRNWVIDAFNRNMPFDRFTIEQIAGDLLEDADEDDLIATAFHRNTMTNSEGGTNDEEFRNAAIVDRVNTTMSVWMATSLGCAQCHDHKYDPLTQQDYFRFFAILNNTEDADLNDESPVLKLYSTQQKNERSKLTNDIAQLEQRLKTPTPQSRTNQAQWVEHFPGDRPWHSQKPALFKAKEGGSIAAVEQNALQITPLQKDELYSLELPRAIAGKMLAARVRSTARGFCVATRRRSARL